MSRGAMGENTLDFEIKEMHSLPETQEIEATIFCRAPCEAASRIQGGTFFDDVQCVLSTASHGARQKIVASIS